MVFSTVAFGQTTEYSFTGNITDSSDSSPILGVSVFLENTSFGGVTDFDGNYTFKASLESKTYMLVASYLGYSTQRVSINLGSTTVINTTISLAEDLLNLDEVVLLGSSIISSRKKLGNTITTVKATTLLKTAPINITTSLQGKVPGAQITQNSGDPAGGFSIRLRGPSTIKGSSEPLYVIDGVVISNLTTNVTNLNVSAGDAQPGQNRIVDINPNDIESINIINGAAAAAIYGSRASNGVVVITTKKGNPMENGPEIFFKTTFNVSSLRKKLDLNLRREEFQTVADSPLSGRLWPIFGFNPDSGDTYTFQLLK